MLLIFKERFKDDKLINVFLLGMKSPIILAESNQENHEKILSHAESPWGAEKRA